MNLFPVIARGALLAVFTLAGCAGAGLPGLISPIPISTEDVDGNYRTLSKCTLNQLSRQHIQLNSTDVADQAAVRIAPASGEWELSFVDEQEGRITRLEMKSPGTPASDHALAIARACSA